MPMVTEVIYQSLYPGIDLIYTLQDGQLKSEFHIQPHTGLARDSNADLTVSGRCWHAEAPLTFKMVSFRMSKYNEVP